MKKVWSILLGVIFLSAGMSWAASQDSAVEDITKEVLVGPGSVSVATKGDLMMSFGAQVRMVPTWESNWDFGMSDNVNSYLAGKLNKRFFELHLNESGVVR
ncbi:MAG: hypothetical protein ACP5TY_01740, partial [Thermodesulforhabdaceae bacterium]